MELRYIITFLFLADCVQLVLYLLLPIVFSHITKQKLITALGAEAVFRALNVAKTADIVAALSLDALKGINVTSLSYYYCYRYS
jgi:hypothetical protein